MNAFLNGLRRRLSVNPEGAPFIRWRLLPVLILVASLAFMIKVGEIAVGARSIGGAIAAAPPAISPEEQAKKDAEKAKPETPKAEEKPEAKEAANDKPADADAAKKDKDTADAAPANNGMAANPAEQKWRDATDEDIDNTAIRQELLIELERRRADIEKQEQALDQREALLKATDQQLQTKFTELESLKSQIESLLKQQSSEEEARIVSLVKIYEGMKPGDAARIFNELDNDILVNVMSLMSERRIGPILAEMNPEKAKTVTVLLAEQRKLPSMPEQNAAP